MTSIAVSEQPAGLRAGDWSQLVPPVPFQLDHGGRAERWCPPSHGHWGWRIREGQRCPLSPRSLSRSLVAMWTCSWSCAGGGWPQGACSP